MTHPYLNTAALLCLLAGCTDALVYGERSGLNLALRTEAIEGQPIEANVGLQRRVVGYVPPRNSEGGRAVDMIAAFNAKREANTPSIFDDRNTIETAFVSGAAAQVAGNSPDSVAAIFDRPGIQVSSNPSDNTASEKILTWATTDVRALEYIAFLQAGGAKPADAQNTIITAQQAALDPKNAALNQKFVKQKNL